MAADFKTSGASTAAMSMDSAAKQFYEQIGFPQRRSFVGRLLARGLIFNGSLNQVELALESGGRLSDALGLLFSVCEELCNERIAAGIPPLDAAPVLLFDEMQDLIKDARLKDAGGRFVFDTLATLIVSYGVDRKAVRVVVAGSSAELYFAFQTTTAKGNRWSVFTLSDPTADVVVNALLQRGYSGEEANAMIARCGSRLRLFEEPLTLGPATCTTEAFLAKAAVAGDCSIRNLFAPLDAAAKMQLVGVLDNVSLADNATSPLWMRPSKEDLPTSLLNEDVSNVFYVMMNRKLHFQSRAIARAWSDVRSEFA